LSDAWISHRNSVAEIDVIICKLSGGSLKLSCTPTLGTFREGLGSQHP
jgi:hypothetical protein